MVTDNHVINKLYSSIFSSIHFGHLHIDKIINTIIINLVNIRLNSDFSCVFILYH
jgi:hypothetical protein